MPRGSGRIQNAGDGAERNERRSCARSGRGSGKTRFRRIGGTVFPSHFRSVRKSIFSNPDPKARNVVRSPTWPVEEALSGGLTRSAAAAANSLDYGPEATADINRGLDRGLIMRSCLGEAASD